MRTSFKNIAVGVVAVVSLIGATLATTASADAHGWHHGGGGFVPGFVAGSALGAFAAAPYYYGEPSYYDYGPDCYRVRQVFINRWGHRVVRWVERCE